MNKLTVNISDDVGKESAGEKLVHTGSSVFLVVGLSTFVIHSILSFYDGDIIHGAGCLVLASLISWSLFSYK